MLPEPEACADPAAAARALPLRHQHVHNGKPKSFVRVPSDFRQKLPRQQRAVHAPTYHRALTPI